MKTAFVVRETRGHWIQDVVAAVRREGFRAELVTEALDDAERAELTSIVDGFVIVDDVRDAPSGRRGYPGTRPGTRGRAHRSRRDHREHRPGGRAT